VSRPVAFPAVSCALRKGSEEELGELLERWNVLGCELDEKPPGRTRVTVYFPPGDLDAARCLADALRLLGAEDLEVGALDEADWLGSYRETLRAFPVGSTWWVDPHPEQPSPAPEGRERLVLEPRSAFGSGSHESTQLILLALEERHLSGKQVLDVGTGSGVLSIAAMRRGADFVVGFDVDPLAVSVARDTVALQESPPGVRLFLGELGAVADGRFDLVLVNIVSGVLLPILPEIRRVLAPDGEAVLAGLLLSEREHAEREAVAAGFEISARGVLGEWLSLELGRG
jgi:ribosomal protein L11 methyltransferase